uniref:Uncharacterized protein n=1 Tax=Timspurckia oligopyrenoides TaxID=708627 RepID=A0A7S1EPM5_9RHOD
MENQGDLFERGREQEARQLQRSPSTHTGRPIRWHFSNEEIHQEETLINTLLTYFRDQNPQTNRETERHVLIKSAPAPHLQAPHLLKQQRADSGVPLVLWQTSWNSQSQVLLAQYSQFSTAQT